MGNWREWVVGAKDKGSKYQGSLKNELKTFYSHEILEDIASITLTNQVKGTRALGLKRL